MPIITQRQLNKLLKTSIEKPLNVVRCETCKAILWSSHVHDWVRCKCPDDGDTYIFLDGGQDYCRYGYSAKAVVSWLDPKTGKWKKPEALHAKGNP